MTKNYLTVWETWKQTKYFIQIQHNRLKPLILKIIQEIKNVSKQDIPSTVLEIPDLPIAFYPFWEGWAYKFWAGWAADPCPESNWNISLNKAISLANYLSSLEEEEVKILFRKWSELEVKNV